MKNSCYVTAKDYFEDQAFQSELLEVLRKSRQAILKSNVKMPDYWNDSVGHENQMNLVNQIDEMIVSLSADQ